MKFLHGVRYLLRGVPHWLGLFWRKRQNSPKQPKKAKTSTLSPDQKNDIIRCVLKRLLRIANKKIWWREMAALRAVPPIIKLGLIVLGGLQKNS